MKSFKEQADSIVEKFIPYTDAADEIGFATHCAITHVEGMLEEVFEFYFTPTGIKRFEELVEILTELKSRL